MCPPAPGEISFSLMQHVVCGDPQESQKKERSFGLHDIHHYLFAAPPKVLLILLSPSLLSSLFVSLFSILGMGIVMTGEKNRERIRRGGRLWEKMWRERERERSRNQRYVLKFSFLKKTFGSVR